MDSFSKWSNSILAGLLFMLLAAPMTFEFVQKYVGKPLGQTFARHGVPTLLGLAVHGLLYALLIKLLMG